MDESAILYQHRMISSEHHHVRYRYERGEIDKAEYVEINAHVTTELERLMCLYRGRPWPVVESEEGK